MVKRADGLVSDRNRFFTETPKTETDHLEKPKFGRNRIFCRKSVVSAERVLFLPKESCFCQYGLLSTEILLYRPKQACFCQSREHTWPIKYYYYYIHERQNI